MRWMGFLIGLAVLSICSDYRVMMSDHLGKFYLVCFTFLFPKQVTFANVILDFMFSTGNAFLEFSILA